MKLYRICTENKNYQDIANYLDEHFPDGYIIINTNGAWQGNREKSLVIEIVGDVAKTESRLESFVYWVRKHNKQQVVLVQVVSLADVWSF